VRFLYKNKKRKTSWLASFPGGSSGETLAAAARHPSFPASPRRRRRKPAGKAPPGIQGWRSLISERDWRQRGPPPRMVGSLAGASRWPWTARLVRRGWKLGRRPQTFSVTLASAVATRAARRMVRRTRYGSAPHLRAVRVVVVVPAEISNLYVGSRRASAWGPANLPNKGGDPWVLLTPRWCSA
jgi:hypothetical protein